MNTFWQDDDSGDTIYLYTSSRDNEVGGGFIITTARQMLKIAKLLADGNIEHSIDDVMISINGRPEYGLINIMNTSDIPAIETILRKIGTIIDSGNLPEVIINGKQVASDRFDIFKRAMDIMNIECKKRQIDVSGYRVKLSLER